MTSDHSNSLKHFALDEVTKVTFYKRDEVTTDLICCDVVVGERVWTFHEDSSDWSALVQRLAKLPGFQADWFDAVSLPPFVACEFVAFSQ